MSKNPLLVLESLGQGIWLDNLRRTVLESGEIKQWIDEDGASGLNSNPSIFEKAIAGIHDDDQAIRALVPGDLEAPEKHRRRVGHVDPGKDINQGSDILKEALESALKSEQVTP